MAIIQYPFVNTFNDIWEYEKSFFSINFEAYIGRRCLICGKDHCYAQISEYYRNAISLFPFKKGLVPVARFLCTTTRRTFSLLPHQLIPYHQYTINAIIGTLMAVYHFQTLGQQGYHGACLSLDPDCLVTPYLVYTWAVLILRGFTRGHPVLNDASPLSTADLSTRKQRVQTIQLYIECFFANLTSRRQRVLAATRYYAVKTNTFLFGRPSGNRIRSP